MPEFLATIRDLLRLFVGNLKDFNNIWGLDIDPSERVCRHIKCDNPIRERIVFVDASIFFSAWREAILMFYGKKERLTSRDLKVIATDSSALKYFEGALNQYLGIYHALGRLFRDEIYFYPRSLGYEIHFFGDNRSYRTINSKLISELRNVKEILVYSPTDIPALKALLGNRIKIEPVIRYINIGQPVLLEKSAVKDSCILTRNLGLTNYWDPLLDGYIQHPLSGKLTVCCGEYMWLTHPSATINNAQRLLNEYISLGATSLIVGCSRAMAIFRAAQKLANIDISIVDFISGVYPRGGQSA